VPDSIYFFPGGRGEVMLEVASFRTGNGMRDGHLRGDMDAAEHPRVTFVADGVVEAPLAQVDSLLAGIVAFSDTLPAARVYIEGRLTIRDSTRAVRIPARIRMSADTLRVRGRLATRFTEFGMKPPSRLLGTVKVKDDIALLFDALFRRTRS
jgi:polyisoprenoid-binding protein YceI